MFLRVKCLVDQVSLQVVWLKMRPDSTPVPKADPSLNYYRLEGLDLGVKEPWTEYVNYSLYYAGPGKFSSNQAKLSPAEFKRIQLLRGKATALDSLDSFLNILYEKFDMGEHSGLHQTQLAHGVISPQWINFFANEYNCSADSAKKLIEFKIDEWRNIQFTLESIREQTRNQIRKAENLDQVTEIHSLACTKLIFNKVNIKALPFIIGKN